MKRLNPKTNSPFKRKDVREDGYIFITYRIKLKTNGYFEEQWLAPNAFENLLKRDSNYSKFWEKTNKQKRLNTKKIWKENNKEKINAATALRRATKLKATPSWLTKEHKKQINNIYKKCLNITKQTGISHNVDHIVPLKGKKVCGLHVPWNLQILTATENNSKNNRLVEH